MSNYEHTERGVLIHDYQKQKTFSSFLPAIAGKDGKPLWAFFANVGQAMGGFGVDSKETPMTPFDSANLAYGNIPVKGFRSMVKTNGKFIQPFFDRNDVHRDMLVGKAELSIVEHNPLFEYEITYFTIPHRSYAGLVRLVKIENKSNKPLPLEVLDGLPVFFPHGLSNFCYKELVSLMAAYCEVHRLKERTPFIKFKTSTGDHAMVEEALEGNGFFAIDKEGNHLDCVVDPTVVFGEDMTNIYPDSFQKDGFAGTLKKLQQTENKLPCAFVTLSKTLKPGETYEFYEVYGNFTSENDYLDAVASLTYEELTKLRKENIDLIASLLKPAKSHTAYPLFDATLAQSYFDNNLRGGFPTLLGEKEVYYLFGRKHGDMERDYNAFSIPSKYYSSGPGNFRDVNQNRRNDLFFAPFVKDYNIRTFFSLIQVDGQNPLSVKPQSFSLKPGMETSLPEEIKSDHEILKLLPHFYPSELFTALVEHRHLEGNRAQEILAKVVSLSSQNIEAAFGEGYWVDHWTYNVDLLESYASIYPDQMEELLFHDNYRYFHSPVFVEPRLEKYCYIEKGKIRQYGAVDLKKAKDYCDKHNVDIQKTDWLKDEKGQVIETNLANKILQLVFIKFSTLDSLQMGIEMECEKPGWNDAMNGLPGLFASGLSESVELLRLVRFARKHLKPFENRSISMMKGQYDFYQSLVKATAEFRKGECGRFAYWDKMTSAREALRAQYKERGEESVMTEKISAALAFLSQIDEILHDGILRAKEAGAGILPSYLIYDLTSYELTDHINHLGYRTVIPKGFTLKTIPPFLEASARALKLGDEFLNQEDIERIKQSDLYDHKLHFYKTSAAIDDAPFEIGRVHAFTKGWLERECNFLHMDYKFLLGLLKGGFIDRFYQEIPSNWVLHYCPVVYGRDPTEASSFVVSSCNPDPSKHGRGYFARLTGANAEFLDMSILLFAGPKIFSFENNELMFHLAPRLSKEFFDKEGKASFTLFGTTNVTIINPSKKNLRGNETILYRIDGKVYHSIKGLLAEQIRSGEIENIEAEVVC